MYYLIHFAFPVFAGTKESCNKWKQKILKEKPNEAKRLIIMSKEEYETIWEEE